MTDKGRLRRAIEEFLKLGPFDELAERIVKFVREQDEIEFVSLMSNILDVLIDFTKNDSSLNALFRDVKARKHQVGAALLSGLGQSVVGGVTGSLLGSILAKPTMLLNAQIRPALPDTGLMLKMRHFGQWQNPYFMAQMALQGFSDNYINDLLEASRQRLDAPQLIPLMRRYPERSQELDKMIKSRGWHPDDLDWLGAATLQHATPNDWIQFAVREATNEAQAQALGLDFDLPAIAQTEAEKSGLAPGLFKLYWRAHWQLPPLTLGYQFLHRFRHETSDLKFTDNDLAGLIKALDYSPIWHKRMMAASYNPITRVDIRRVLKAGKLNEAGVRKAYWKDGYDDEDADLLTDWTMWEAQSSMRDLSLARVEEAVEKGIMTELEARLGMEDLRIDPEDIERYIKLWAYDREKKRVNADVDYLSAQYLNNEIDEQNLRSKLTNLGLTPNNVYIAITNLNAKRKRQITPLTTREIYEMFSENIIDNNTALSELFARGVNKTNAERQMRLILVKRQRVTDKELKEQQEELDKQQAKAIRNEKAIALAGVNVKIAALNAEVTDLKVIYPDITDIEVLSGIDSRLLVIKQEIAYLSLEKAKINLQFAEKEATNGNG